MLLVGGLFLVLGRSMRDAAAAATAAAVVAARAVAGAVAAAVGRCDDGCRRGGKKAADERGSWGGSSKINRCLINIKLIDDQIIY